MNTINLTTTSNKKTPDNKIISVLLIEEQPDRRSMLKKALVDFGYYITKHLACDDDIIAEIELCNPNIIVLVTDLPSDKVLKELSEINQLIPLPIIIFAENDSPSVIKRAIKAGVSAYVINETLPQRVKSVISVANERFKEVQSLRNELKLTKTQLESRKLIERAKGLIMLQKHVNEKDAYEMLRKSAMNQGCSLAVVAKNIIDVCELLSTS